MKLCLSLWTLLASFSAAAGGAIGLPLPHKPEHPKCIGHICAPGSHHHHESSAPPACVILSSTAPMDKRLVVRFLNTASLQIHSGEGISEFFYDSSSSSEERAVYEDPTAFGSLASVSIEDLDDSQSDHLTMKVVWDHYSERIECPTP